MIRTSRPTSIRPQPSPGLRLLFWSFSVLMVLMLVLTAWGLIDGWILDTTGASDGVRALFTMLASLNTLMALGITWCVDRPNAFHLAAADVNGGSRSTELLMLEQLGNDPDATPRDREELREVVAALKARQPAPPEADQDVSALVGDHEHSLNERRYCSEVRDVGSRSPAGTRSRAEPSSVRIHEGAKGASALSGD